MVDRMEWDDAPEILELPKDDPREDPEYWAALLSSEGLGELAEDGRVVPIDTVPAEELEEALGRAAGTEAE